MITNEEKDSIRKKLRIYIDKFPSQNKAAASLKNTSSATVSTIMAGGNDERISEAMWRTIAAQVGGMAAPAEEWQVVETFAYQEITTVMLDAQCYANVTWITGEAGCGKTTAARSYTAQNKNAFYILCTDDMQRTGFVREIARVIGLRSDGSTRESLIEMISQELTLMDAPLLIFDEADKLSESVFRYMISMYNKFEGVCGMVYLSTDSIIKRIETGVSYCRPGYKEFFSRIGRKFFILSGTNSHDVQAICVVNGVTDKDELAMIKKEAAACENDLRRVRKYVGIVKRTRRRRTQTNAAAS